MTENRHTREVHPQGEEHDHLGFIVDFQDPNPNVDGVRSDDPVDVQIKPHPDGYQVTLWWTSEDGDRKTNNRVVRLEDPRDLI